MEHQLTEPKGAAATNFLNERKVMATAGGRGGLHWWERELNKKG